MKKPVLQNKEVGVLGMAFRDFQETGPRTVSQVLMHRKRLKLRLDFDLRHNKQ